MLWWLPPALVTLGATAWVSWLGRARDEAPDRSEAAQARMGAALGRDLPTSVRRPAPRPQDRSTGIAVRPSQRPTRDSAPGQGPGSSRLPDEHRRSA